MNEGPPTWWTDEARLTSPRVKAGDAEIWSEVCSWHLRVGSDGWFRDDAQWESKESGQTVPLKDVIAWCQALATGEDTSVTEEVFSRRAIRSSGSIR